MSIKPEEINAGKLPTAVRGYQREATENLLKLVAWDYRRALRDKSAAAEELERLKTRIEQLEAETEVLRQEPPPAAEVARVAEGQTAELESVNERLQAALEAEERRAEEIGRLKERSEQLEAEAEALRRELAEVRVHDGLHSENERLRAALEAQEQRKELTTVLLASAIRSARELRQQARLECDALIRAGRRRAVQIEEEARRSVKRSTGELDRLQKIEHDLREQLRRTLQQVIDGEVPRAPAAQADDGGGLQSPAATD